MENIGNIGIASVAAITVICYLAGLIAKALPLDDRYIPIVCGVCGAVLGVAGLYLGYDGALSALLYGSVLAALSALVLILGKKMTAKDTIPLVPFLYVGILLTEFVR